MGSKRFHVGEITQKEAMEVEEAALSLQETGFGDFPKGRAKTSSDGSGSQASHRKRRFLAMHHKEHIREDPREDEDDTSFMAMGRARSEPTSPSPDSDPDNAVTEANKDNGGDQNLTGAEGAAMATVEPEDTEGNKQIRTLMRSSRWKVAYCRTQRRLHPWVSAIVWKSSSTRQDSNVKLPRASGGYGQIVPIGNPFSGV